jgi:hypothetical protein
LDVFLFLTSDAKPLFYAEDPDKEGHDLPHHRGLRGWADRKLRELRLVWKSAESGLIAWLRALWEWLERRTPADEMMLIRLRTASEIQVYHPSTVSGDDARNRWRDFLASRYRRHLPRLGFNLAICPLGLVLGFLPGPNVVGYWFAYRAVRHGLALLGIRRASSPEVRTSFHAAPALNQPVDQGPDVRWASTLGLDPEKLAHFVERSELGKEQGPGATDGNDNPIRLASNRRED